MTLLSDIIFEQQKNYQVRWNLLLMSVVRYCVKLRNVFVCVYVPMCACFANMCSNKILFHTFNGLRCDLPSAVFVVVVPHTKVSLFNNFVRNASDDYPRLFFQSRKTMRPGASRKVDGQRLLVVKPLYCCAEICVRSTALTQNRLPCVLDSD